MGLLLLLMWLEGVCLSHILRPRFFVILWHWLFLAHFLLLVAFDFLLAIFVSLGRRFLLREFDRLREVDDVLVFGRRDLLLNRLCNFFGLFLSVHDDLHAVIYSVGPERSPLLCV